MKGDVSSFIFFFLKMSCKKKGHFDKTSTFFSFHFEIRTENEGQCFRMPSCLDT